MRASSRARNASVTWPRISPVCPGNESSLPLRSSWTLSLSARRSISRSLQAARTRLHSSVNVGAVGMLFGSVCGFVSMCCLLCSMLIRMMHLNTTCSMYVVYRTGSTWRAILLVFIRHELIAAERWCCVASAVQAAAPMHGAAIALELRRYPTTAARTVFCIHVGLLSHDSASYREARVFPVARVQLGVGRALRVRADAKQRLEGVEGEEAAVEAEGELVQVGLEVLRRDAVVNTQQPRLEVREHEVDER